MSKLLLTILMFCINSFSFAQNSFKRNDIYLEAGGNGLFGSVNFERQLTKDPGLGVRVGLGFYSEYDFYLTFPIGINYLFPLKNKKSFIDAGLGGTWTTTSITLVGNNHQHYAGDYFMNFIPSIGYRRHTDKNVMWRFSFSPVINKYAFTPWAGVSIGKRF